MTFYIKNNVRIAGLTAVQENLIIKHLTIDNPIFHRKYELGLSLFGVPSMLQYYQTGDESLVVPVGALPDIIEIILNNGGTIEKSETTLRFKEHPVYKTVDLDGHPHKNQKRF